MLRVMLLLLFHRPWHYQVNVCQTILCLSAWCALNFPHWVIL